MCDTGIGHVPAGELQHFQRGHPGEMREPGGEAYLDEALERSRHILPLPVVQQDAAPPAEPQIIPLTIRKVA